ncbi:two-component system nitrate/nitrite sensor histidine kinase NarX [Pseudomonas sp. SJZ103]|nr:two-component system nitrate/nitrite sensor histidine kinase NarX [Pseudomonas sp. SJZ103]TWC77575.1 two-component system nitrate/nitrite sensor histidine kinase NarX [Pseudomonas sp. SJZ094]
MPLEISLVRRPFGAWKLLGLSTMQSNRTGSYQRVLTRPKGWPLWLGPIRREQARSVRRLLAELPLHADGALSGFLDRFDALLPPARLNLILGGEDLGPTRRGWVDGCQEVARCPWRDASVTDAPQACGPCRQRGVHRLVCALPEGEKGALLLDTPRRAGASWRQLLEEAAQAVGVTVRLRSHNREQQRKQATSRHGALARELHDSVAQQLGYLSFQAHGLQSQLGEPALQDLCTGLSQLQRQVRELITSARLTMDGRSLRQALADSVAEFSRRCIIVFELDNRLADDALSPETELQILQIIREALANAVRHSHARHVRIELRQTQDGDASVSVEDDGIGLIPACDEHNHFGLAIIRERAASIGARLSIEAIRPHGVRVHLGLRRHHDLPQGSFDGLHDLITDR